MSILIDKKTKLLVQGITGREGDDARSPPAVGHQGAVEPRVRCLVAPEPLDERGPDADLRDGRDVVQVHAQARLPGAVDGAKAYCAGAEVEAVLDRVKVELRSRSAPFEEIGLDRPAVVDDLLEEVPRCAVRDDGHA